MLERLQTHADLNDAGTFEGDGRLVQLTQKRFLDLFDYAFAMTIQKC